MSFTRRFINAYARFVSHRIYIVLALVIVLLVAAVYFQGQVGTESMDNSDTLPDDIEVIQAFETISSKFGGSDSIQIAIQIDPRNADSDEARDIRDPDVVQYIDILAELAKRTDDVMSVSSFADVLRNDTDDPLPKSIQEIRGIVEQNPSAYSYISRDYTLSIISIRLSDDYGEDEIVGDLQDIIDQVRRPSGVTANVAGSVATGPVIQESIGPDIARTSQFSMIGIAAILLLIFMSVRYALTPLAVIGVGIVWAMGFFGLMGMNLSSASSGAISMIMGIGIDFGIQTISRFKSELKENKPEKAMEITLQNVIAPMATTTIAALIGFQAMSMGQLTVMKELGTIMSFGVAFCFVAAITIVPVISIMGENLSDRMDLKRRLRDAISKD